MNARTASHCGNLARNPYIPDSLRFEPGQKVTGIATRTIASPDGDTAEIHAWTGEAPPPPAVGGGQGREGYTPPTEPEDAAQDDTGVPGVVVIILVLLAAFLGVIAALISCGRIPPVH